MLWGLMDFVKLCGTPFSLKQDWRSTGITTYFWTQSFSNIFPRFQWLNLTFGWHQASFHLVTNNVLVLSTRNNIHRKKKMKRDVIRQSPMLVFVWIRKCARAILPQRLQKGSFARLFHALWSSEWIYYISKYVAPRKRSVRRWETSWPRGWTMSLISIFGYTGL